MQKYEPVQKVTRLNGTVLILFVKYESFRNQLEEVEKVESEAKKANADKLLTAQQIAIQTENTAYEIKKANVAIKYPLRNNRPNKIL